jgi:hypothetical protein
MNKTKRRSVSWRAIRHFLTRQFRFGMAIRIGKPQKLHVPAYQRIHLATLVQHVADRACLVILLTHIRQVEMFYFHRPTSLHKLDHELPKIFWYGNNFANARKWDKQLFNENISQLRGQALYLQIYSIRSFNLRHDRMSIISVSQKFGDRL